MKTAIITGATSSIGLALMDSCLKNDCRVVAITREGSARLQRIPESPRIEVITADLDRLDRCPLADKEIVDGVFYHFAWSATDKASRNDPTRQQDNIRYTLNALRFAKRIGCKKFVGAGSQAEYGIHLDSKTTPDSPTNPKTAYGVCKYAAGRLASILADALEIDCFWVRIFSVYGPNDIPGTMIRSSIERMARGEHCSFTEGTHLWDYLYSEDAGKAFYAIGERATGNKVYCLGYGQARQLRDYICDLRDIVAPGLELGLGEIPYSDQNSMGMCADITALTRDTGWSPEIDFKRGIRQMLKR